MISQGHHKASSVYKPKHTEPSHFNRNAYRFSQALQDKIKEELKDLLYFFGYTNHPSKENEYAAFTFENHSDKDLQNYEGFR